MFDPGVKYTALKKLCKEYGLILMWDEPTSQWFLGRIQDVDGISYRKIFSVSTISLTFTPWDILERKITGAVVDSTFDSKG